VKAASYNVPAEVVDGMDVVAVEAAARRTVAAIRSGSGPALLECRTYRFRAHSMFDPQLYREKAEIEDWRKRDPIDRFANWLRQSHNIHDADIALVEQAIAAEIEHSVAFAEAGQWEPEGMLTTEVYAESTPA
jgi:TPP-dependent pyruvate/acetoin dehydrogenase alpha subunit